MKTRSNPIQSTFTSTGFHLYHSYPPSLFYFCLSIHLVKGFVCDRSVYLLYIYSVASRNNEFNPNLWSHLFFNLISPSIQLLQFFIHIAKFITATVSSEFETCPFYPYHFDYTEIILVAHASIGDHYIIWSPAMKMTISAKNRLGPVRWFHSETWTQWCEFCLLDALQSYGFLLDLEPIHKDLTKTLFTDLAFLVWKYLSECFPLGNAPWFST